MTDEEFLKLARELGTMSPEREDEKFIVFSGAVIFPNRITFLTLCREIERRTLERAAEKCAQNAKRNFTWGSENSDRYHGFADGAEKCAASIRAMIKEKE